MTFPKEPPEITEQEILQFLALVYDPFGLTSPKLLLGKIVYREVLMIIRHHETVVWKVWTTVAEGCMRPP